MKILPPCAATSALNCAILSASAAAAADSLCASSSFFAACCLVRHSARFASLQGSQPAEGVSPDRYCCAEQVCVLVVTHRLHMAVCLTMMLEHCGMREPASR